MRLKMLSASLMLVASVGQAAVTVSGDVANPGPVKLPPGGRLLDVIGEAVPNAEGYWLAGGLLRQSLIEEQTRLKVGVLFDLDVLNACRCCSTGRVGRHWRSALPNKCGRCR